MGLFSIIKGIITFPFRIFRRRNNRVEPIPLPPPPELPPMPQPGRQPLQTEPARQIETRVYERTDEVNKTKLDLIIAELDTLKSLNQALGERLKLIERKLEEKERGIRYV